MTTNSTAAETVSPSSAFICRMQRRRRTDESSASSTIRSTERNHK